jgi:RND superfamily putative drug exporter
MGLCEFRILTVVVAVKAIVLNLLSVSAALGALVVVFQNGHGSALVGVAGGTGAVFSSIPIFAFAIVFGLSMDYEVFIVARMREARRSGLSEIEAIADRCALSLVRLYCVSAVIGTGGRGDSNRMSKTTASALQLC